MNMNETQSYPTKEGREAYIYGEPLSSCPYPEGSEEAIDWEGGWMEAEENNGS